MKLVVKTRGEIYFSSNDASSCVLFLYYYALKPFATGNSFIADLQDRAILLNETLNRNSISMNFKMILIYLET